MTLSGMFTSAVLHQSSPRTGVQEHALTPVLG